MKKFQWRNARLEALFLWLEACDEEQKKANPKNAVGCKPRTRVRDDPLFSETKAPVGLPFDCYDPEWLENLRINDPDQYDELRVVETPKLDSLEKQADAVLKLRTL